MRHLQALSEKIKTQIEYKLKLHSLRVQTVCSWDKLHLAIDKRN